MKKLAVFVAFVFAVFAFVPAQAAKVSPTEIQGAQTIDAAKAKELFDRGVTFVDVRKDSDFESGRVPGAVHIELKKKLSADSLGAAVKKDQEVVIYCNGPKCMRSSKACAKAVAWGYSKVYYFRTGMPSWKEAGYPVE